MRSRKWHLFVGFLLTTILAGIFTVFSNSAPEPSYAQGGTLYNYHVFLPLVLKPSPYVLPLCFGEDIDWEGMNQTYYEGGNDSVGLDTPTISYPSTCIGWLHRDNSLQFPFPDQDVQTYIVPDGTTGHLKITVAGLPDGAALDWLYCYDPDCNAFEYQVVAEWDGSDRVLIVPLLAEGNNIRIDATQQTQYDNTNPYTLTLEVVP